LFQVLTKRDERLRELLLQASLEQRQRFQRLFFPDGIAFDGKALLEPA
jgi:hypothetical protein